MGKKRKAQHPYIRDFPMWVRQKQNRKFKYHFKWRIKEMKSNKKLICKMISSGKTYDELRRIYQKKFLKPFNYRIQG
ncbi:unnamed protein product [Oikopleura dioica]|uniref:Uncharacterized protein n=1 Tax=Oikopleura dioica TaxID=34765 RepID=E4WSH6_OIKDI|nr:unnamed protein product [Oikopleura dioica]